MKKFRLFSAILAVSMLFTVAVSADFSDMPSDIQSAKAITNAVSNGILSGYDDGTVRPDANITRAEMASIITRALGASKEADISEFSDVPADSWYYSAFAKAYAMGAISGDDQKRMNPQNNITFQECFTILSQVFDLLPPYTRVSGDVQTSEYAIFTAENSRLYDISCISKYADNSSIADWAKIFVAGVVANGGWDGENGNLTPTAYITRGQFARVMDNIVKNYIDEPGTYTELPEGNTMIRTNGVILNGVYSESDIYVSDCVEPDGIKMGDIEINRLVVRGCATDTDDEEVLANSDPGISIAGTFNAIRVIRPWISANLENAKFKSLYTAPQTHVDLGLFD